MRQHRSLHAVIFTALALAWLVALIANVQNRTALAQLCATVAEQDMHAPHHGSTETPSGHAHHLPSTSKPVPVCSTEAPSKHTHHHGPDCLLCIALATPPAMALTIERPPVPVAHQSRRSPSLAVPVWRAQAPLPARGPPAPSHA